MIFSHFLAHTGILPNIDGPKDLQLLFDFDTETCLNVWNTLFKMGEIRLDMIIRQKIEDGLVRVYFSQKIMCEARQVIDSGIHCTQATKHARDPPWLWNPGETSPEVQNRDISGPTKRKCPAIFKKKIAID